MKLERIAPSVLARSLIGLWAVVAAVAVQAQSVAAAAPQRHALIVAIGDYGDPTIPPLRGIRHDVASAGRIAEALAVPPANVRVLRDTDATAAAIRYQLRLLAERVAPGDRVFVYYSGHGTRVADPAGTAAAGPAGGPGATTCTEGLLAADGRVLGNADLAEAMAPLARKADKLMVFYDACYSGGVANEVARARSLRVAAAPGAAAAEDTLTPKFVRLGNACGDASNVRSRSLAAELGARQTWPENVVHVAASRSDEVSFDSAGGGGFATRAWRDCLLGEARDIDGSGAVTVAEVTACAQVRLNRLLAGLPGVAGQTMVVAGNAQIVPANAAMAASVAAVAVPAAAEPAIAAAPGPAVARALASNAQVLAEVHAQRDGARALEMRVAQPRLVAGRDALALEIRSPRDGHLYIALAHADGRGLTLLYPNALDDDNRIAAGVPRRLPGPKWAVLARPPAGTETLLALVTDRPRDLNALLLDPESRASPFMRSLVDGRGRAVLQQVLVGGEAFGAAMVEVETVMPPGR